MTDPRYTADGEYLSSGSVLALNERHGWFSYGDAQSDVSRAFANNAVHAFLESAKEAQQVLQETGLTPRQLVEQRAELLEALQTCLSFIEDAHIVEGQWSWEPTKIARAALAKARGTA